MHWTQNPKWEEKRKEWKLKLKNRKPNKGSFYKGMKSLWKGKHISWVGHSMPHTEEAKEKMRLHASIRIGKLNNKWKGNDICHKGNKSLHQWVKRQLGSPNKCEHCGTTQKRMYHWANKSHEYKRELSDWIRLCVPCHKKFDLMFIKKV